MSRSSPPAVSGETAPADGDNINLFHPPSCAPDFTKNLNVTAIALNNLGDAHVMAGRFAEAVGYYEEALTLFRNLGERYGETCALNGLGEALGGYGSRDEAVARHVEALALATEIDNHEEQTRARDALARLRPT